MSTKAQDLTQGRLSKQILLFSLPLMVSNVLQVLFNMADIAVVGRYAGSLALGAVGSTTILVTLFTGFLIGMGTGINVLVARHFGAKSDRDVTETVQSAFLLMILEGVLFALLGVTFARRILQLMGTKPELIDGATLYLRIYFLGMPAVSLFNFGSAVFSAVGNTRKPLQYLSAAGVINVLLNLFFVLVLNMDVDGVAIASVVSQYISASLIVLSLLRSRESFALRLSGLRLNPEKSRTILALGVPSGAQNALFAFANLFIQAGVNSFDATMVAGNAAAANADGLVYDVMAAFYVACASFMSQNLGAGKKERILRSYHICNIYSFGVGALFGLSLVLFGRQFLSLFTTEEAVIEAGMRRLTVMAFSYPMSAFMDNAIAASRGLGKSVVPMILVILGACVFRVLWIYTIFAYFHTIASLYLLYVFSWTLTGIAEIIYFAHCYRQQVACRL